MVGLEVSVSGGAGVLVGDIFMCFGGNDGVRGGGIWETIGWTYLYVTYLASCLI